MGDVRPEPTPTAGGVPVTEPWRVCPATTLVYYLTDQSNNMNRKGGQYMARRTDPDEVARKKSRIADEAARLFATQGFENTSVAQIAAAVGTSPASIFYYFPDKASLFRAPFEQDIPAAERLIAEHADAADPLEAVLAIVDALAAEAAYPYAQGMLVESLRRMGHDPELIAASEQAAATQRAGLAALISRAMQDGQIDRTLDPSFAAQWVLTIIDACYLNAEPGRSPSPEVRRTVLGYLKGTDRGGKDHE